MITAPDEVRSRAISIRPVGGLGNQLFIYAAGRAVADRLGCALLVDLSRYRFLEPGDTPRTFMLDWLLSPDQILPLRDRSWTSRSWQRLQRHVSILRSRSFFRESGFAYDPQIAKVRPGTTLEGYFQSWHYFSSIENPLRSDILARAPRSPWFRTEEARLEALGPWLGVHVRRGDYLVPRNASYHGVLGKEYYSNALEATPDSDALPLVLFSDDIERARELIEPLHPIAHTVTPPKTAHPMESIILMGRSRALVIANSSFSWWGAWLAREMCTAIVAPNPWFVSGVHRESDLCPPTWNRITVIGNPG